MYYCLMHLPCKTLFQFRQFVTNSVQWNASYFTWFLYSNVNTQTLWRISSIHFTPLSQACSAENESISWTTVVSMLSGGTALCRERIQRNPSQKQYNTAVEAVTNRHTNISKAHLVARKHFNKSFDPGTQAALYSAAVLCNHADTYWADFVLKALHEFKTDALGGFPFMCFHMQLMPLCWGYL